MATGFPHDATPNAKRFALCLMGIGFALRCRGYLDAWPNPDEGAYYAIAITSTWSAFWAEIAHHTHPPGIYILHRLLAQVAEIGDSLAWLRLPSLLGGSAAIYGIFLAGRELGGDRAGLIAAAMFAVSPASIVLSQVLRPYGVFAAALSFGTAALLRYGRSGLSGQRGETNALAIATIALSVALFVHYSSLLVLPAATAILMHGAFKARQRGESTLAPIATLLLWAVISLTLLATHIVPNLLGSPLQDGAQESWLADSFHSSLIGALRALPGLFQLGAGRFFAWGALLAFIAGLTQLGRERKWNALALSGGTLLIAIHASWWGLYPLGATRHGLYLIVLLTPVTALGIDAALRRGRHGAVGAVLFMSVAIGIARPAPGAIEERLATRADFEKPLAELDSARDEGGLWLLDRQTYRMLAPYFGRAGETRERDTRHPGIFTWFDWGKTRVVVAPPWRIHLGPNDVVRPSHVFGALLRASRVEEIQTARFRRGMLILGGWNLRSETDGAPAPLVIRPIDWVDYIARVQPLAR